MKPATEKTIKSRSVASPSRILANSIVGFHTTMVLIVALIYAGFSPARHSPWALGPLANHALEFAHVLIGKPVPTFPGHALIVI
jgi:hypothetical protein